MRKVSFPAGLLLAAAMSLGGVAQADLINTLTIEGNTPDLAPLGGGTGGTNVNRLGMFSDLYYDHAENAYYGLADRGPGGGLISYETRVEKFKLQVNPVSGAISNFQLIQTIKFKDAAGNPFNGLNPGLLNSNKAVLGQSFDPEGFVRGNNGRFYVSDEYGPSAYEFSDQGVLLRTLTPPANLLPRQLDNSVNYVDGRTTIVTGRQDNRGFEGMTISPDGTKLYAIMQDPLVNEGSDGDANLTDGEGRQSRNLRVIEYDLASGQSSRQFIYQLEPLASINARVPGSPFSSSAQGRNIGVSSITAINANEFLVIERDNRGLGVEDPTAATEVASKRVYRIDISGATDVSNISLNDTNVLPVGVMPVAKDASPYIDIVQTLKDAGQIVPEKLEGLTIGPKLADGTFLILIGTDNDFSVTQTGAGVQEEVVIKGDPLVGPISDSTKIALDASLPEGFKPIPGFLYAFKSSHGDAVTNGFIANRIPEPATAGLLAGLGGVLLVRRRRR